MTSHRERPYHEVVVDEDYEDWMGNLFAGQVGPLATLRMIDAKAGDWPNGDPRIPSLRNLVKFLTRYGAAVDAGRAKLISETIAYDNWKAKPSSDEWDPDQRNQDAANDADPGLPRRED